MRVVLNWPVRLALILIIAWLALGRQLTSVLDRFIGFPVASLPVNPLEYDGGGLVIGQLNMTFGLTDNLRSGFTLHCDSLNRVVLSSGGQSFILGPRTNPVDLSGRPELEFVAERGDRLSFTATRSVVGWPTPFAFNLMESHSPWWRRYAYYRLEWKKAEGARLEMRWRYEQLYYWATGWTKPEMLWNSHTGLIGAHIREYPSTR